MHFARSRFPRRLPFRGRHLRLPDRGGRLGGAGPNHWDSFAATPGNVVRAEDGAIACDHYHRWEDDLDLIAALGADTYRFSTSWARVLPDGTGTPNAKASISTTGWWTGCWSAV
jgi:beta-glucosidase